MGYLRVQNRSGLQPKIRFDSSGDVEELSKEQFDTYVKDLRKEIAQG